MLSNQELKDIYEDRYSGTSVDHSVREKEQYRKFFHLLLNWDPKKCAEINYLDLGCGLGAKTVGFEHGFKKTIAIDLSQNAIEFCKLKFSDSSVEWIAGDAMKVDGKFDLISAFGFSLFNTGDNDEFVQNVRTIIQQNLEESGVMIVGSFTDYSGTGESWFMHSVEDLEYIKTKLMKENKVKIEIIFPHRYRKNYLASGFINCLAELRKLLVSRRRIFFIKIVHE
jgi:SAM-dependent methyltransferase